MTPTRALATKRFDERLRMTVDFCHLFATIRIPNGKHETAVGDIVYLQIMFCIQLVF
jgi:hypothetical protein